MRLNALQAELEGHYDVRTPCRVEDFLFHDRFLAGELSGDPALQGAPEALLVSQANDDLDVSLFLDPAVMQALTGDELGQQGGQDAASLAAFWVALEGVSHFLYLVWSAAFNRCVTLLEMELQAEVDKFVIAARRLHRQCGHVRLDALRSHLFGRVAYREQLDGASRERYWQANRLAAVYCEAIADDLLQRRRQPQVDAELRRFYRMDQRQKMRHIRQLVG